VVSKGREEGEGDRERRSGKEGLDKREDRGRIDGLGGEVGV